MRGIIIGKGQIGISLFNILKEHHDIKIRDKEDLVMVGVEILHICFPYFEGFIDAVKEYQEEYSPDYTVIHSTVPVGTSRKCGATHSPVRGIHPNLEKGIKTFTKFLGGESASEVADYFRRAGLTVYLTDKPETTELIKIWSTSFYAIDIEMTKQIKRDCDENGLPFEMWSLWVDTYNTGYGILGHREYNRPNLIPIMKKQGGHCTVPNAAFLDNEFTKLIKKLNK